VDSLASLTAQPKPLVVGDKTYQMHPLTIDDFGALQAWCDSQYKDPLEAIAPQLGSGKFTKRQEEFLMRVAVETAHKPKPRLGEPEVDALLNSLEGFQQVAYLSIRKGLPTFTQDDARELIKAMGNQSLARMMMDTNADMILGSAPANGDGDPKATMAGAMTPPANR
jgi:hypothetical protein